MTNIRFYQQLEQHSGGLVRLKIDCPPTAWRPAHAAQVYLNGRIGLLLNVIQPASGKGAWVTMHIDGNTQSFHVLPEEVELIGREDV